MKNDDLVRSLSRMAEEYNRLVSPLTRQLKIYDRWNEIESPILRIAEMHNNVLKGVTAFDTSLAQHLAVITEPYQPMLDNMATIESLMETRFSELVHPQIYIPGIASSFTTNASAVAQIGREVNLVSDAATIAVQTAQPIKPWQTNLNVLSAFDTALADSHFSRLVGIEKAVAGLSGVIEQYDQMTSISAQLASLQQIGLTDAWKKAIIPPVLLLELNDFALKQYEHIQRATDDKTIAWRLGLIDVASKFVDDQVTWGSTLAVESDKDAPEVEIAIPDFSELPSMLGSAKRDNKDVEKAFDESQLVEITGMGKLIIQKAKAVNDFCKARQIPLLFPEADLLNWAMILSGSFCRDADNLNDVLDTLYSMFVRKPVVDLIGHHRCFVEIESNRCTTETKKRNISRTQRQIYWQIIGVEDELISHFEDAAVSIFDEDRVSSNVLKALLTVQSDKLYEGANENNINDGIRSQLKWVYEVKDQTRQGDSESGKDAGEVDIMLCDNGNPAVILEGLKLDSFKQDYLDTHINKALVNYDPNGCPLVYILIYVTGKRFSAFWDKVMAHMISYNFPYETVEGMHEVATAYTDSRRAKAVLNRNGKSISVYLYAIAMR